MLPSVKHWDTWQVIPVGRMSNSLKRSYGELLCLSSFLAASLRSVLPFPKACICAEVANLQESNQRAKCTKWQQQASPQALQKCYGKEPLYKVRGILGHLGFVAGWIVTWELWTGTYKTVTFMTASQTWSLCTFLKGRIWWIPRWAVTEWSAWTFS